VLYGGIEGGGTKFMCAVGDESGQIVARDRIPTTQPEETIPHVIRYFKQFERQRGERLAAFGIASFGPRPAPGLPYYGYITGTQSRMVLYNVNRSGRRLRCPRRVQHR
jgi:fructokinase